MPIPGSQSNKFIKSNLPYLPDVVVKLMLSYLPDWPTSQEILNSRLVCVQWNQLIEDTSKLMKKITIPIWHPKPFLDLPIIKTGKAKSINFKDSFPFKYLGEIINHRIGCTIEKVQFAFEEPYAIDSQQEIFVTILRYFTNIRELIIGDSHTAPQRFLAKPLPATLLYSGGLLWNAASTIKHVKVYMNSFGLGEANGLVQILLLLPKLEKITLVCINSYGEYFSTILTGLSNYMEMHQSNLYLKVCTKTVHMFSGSSLFNLVGTRFDIH